MRAKTLFRAIAGVALALLLTYGVEYWRNNRAATWPSTAKLGASFDLGADWLSADLATNVKHRNPIVWWMLSEAAQQSADPRLEAALAAYSAMWLDPRPPSIWRNLFDPNAQAPRPNLTARTLPYYNFQMLHALTCDGELGGREFIQAQYAPDFCRGRVGLLPTCVSHQLLAVRFALRSGCGDATSHHALQTVLQERIVAQLTRDPRVVDVYVQRLLLLADSGARARIKPVWVRRLLEAQLPDGGWGDFDPRLPLPRGYALGYSSSLLGVERPRSLLHTTAQALWLLTILRSSEDPPGPTASGPSAATRPNG